MEKADLNNLKMTPMFILEDKIKSYSSQLDEKIKEFKAEEAKGEDQKKIFELKVDVGMLKETCEFWLNAKKIKEKEK